MTKYINYVLEHYKIFFIVIILVTLPMGYFFMQKKYFNSVEVYFEKDNKALLEYQKFQENYGNDELAVIVFKVDNIFTNKNINLIRTISKILNDDNGVQRVFSLTESEEAKGAGDTIRFLKIIPDKELTKQELLKIKNRFLSDNLYVNSLISKDSKTTAITFEIEKQENNEKKSIVLNNIRNKINKAVGKKVKLMFSGQPYLEVEINNLSHNDNNKFTPYILIIIILIVTVILRNFSLAILTVSNLLIVLLWAVGFFTLTGETINMATTIIAPVLLAISIADAIHLLAHFQKLLAKHDGESYKEMVAKSIKAVWFPALFTSLTTAVGFFSFILSSIRPVKIVGIFTSIGVAFAFFLTITFLPAAIILFKDKIKLKKEEDGKNHWIDEGVGNFLDKIANFTVTKFKTIVAIFIIITLVAIIGIFKIKFQTNFATYLPKDSKIRQDIDFIDKNVGGTIPFILLIKAKDKAHDFTHPESIKKIAEIQKHLLTALNQFSNSFTIADYLREINKAFNNDNPKFYKLPKTKETITDYYEVGDSEVMDRVIAPDYMETRLSFNSHWGSNEEAEKNNTFIMNYLKKKLGKNFTFTRTGLSPLYLTMGDNLKSSQIKSFGFAFVIIFIMMLIITGNIKFGIISIIPNIFPIFLTLGIMGWLNIPLDISTIMIASVVIGIAVDDTIHFTVWFKRNIKNKLNTSEAILKTFKDVGKPIVLTSVVLFLGFFILIFGSIKPTKSFGVLTAFSMLFALIGDIFIYPALLMLFKVKDNSK